MVKWDKLLLFIKRKLRDDTKDDYKPNRSIGRLNGTH